MNNNFDNLSGIITGAGNGIGLSAVVSLLNSNFNVYAITRSKSKKLEEIKKKFQGRLQICYQDISNFSKTRKLIKNICLKEKKICFLINNAGIRKRKSFLKLSIEEHLDVMNINFFSHVNITKEYLKNTQSKSVKKHKIVFITSIVGPRGFNELSAYAVSKSALESLSRSLSIEFKGKNYLFNSVAPGFIKTSYADNFKKNKKNLYKWTLTKTPLKRWGEPSEIAEIINFLVSDKSSYINGSVIYADGGWTAE